jgi:murein hydrolase activator
MMRVVPLVALLTLGAAPPSADRLVAAKQAAAAAERRAAVLAAEAAGARRAAGQAAADERVARARVEAAAAQLDAARARVALVDARLAEQRAELGRQEAPAARLLAALQSLARRPAIATVAQPGSVEDLVRLRAVLGSVLPAVRARAAGIAGEVAATRRLQDSATLAAVDQRSQRIRLEAERTALARLEQDQRARARALGRGAMSEGDRALALGERARELVEQMGEEGRAAVTASTLAGLSGPVPRPIQGGVAASHAAYRLPIAGQLVTGFGEVSRAGVRSRGLTFRVVPGRAAVAPAGGTVRYAGRFRSYGTIVILDHGAGWSTLVTGLARTPLTRGSVVSAGRPLGITEARSDGAAPEVTVELRRQGRPVDLLAIAG